VKDIVADQVTSVFKEVAGKLEETLGTAFKDVTEKITSLTEEVEKIKVTPVSQKSEADEDSGIQQKSENPFKGVLFQ
jgi:hypothetical protein